MNTIQRLIIVFATVTIIVLCLFPPWKIPGHSGMYGSFVPEKSIGHHYWTPRPAGGKVHVGRLVAMLGIVIVTASGLVWVFHKKKD
jgi:hypothetical protein